VVVLIAATGVFWAVELEKLVRRHRSGPVHTREDVQDH